MTQNKTDRKNYKKSTDNTVDLSRRRLAKAGLIAAPILSTLHGKPAMATYAKNNCTVSGNLSGNMSDNANNDDPCDNYLGGKTPGYWGQHPNKWANCGLMNQYEPGTCMDGGKNKGGGGSGCQNYDGDGTKFHDYFGGARQYDGDGNSYSMMQVIHETGNIDTYQLDAHTVAALLNAECYGAAIYGYSPDDVINMYNMYHDTHPIELKQAFQYLNELDNPTDP